MIRWVASSSYVPLSQHTFEAVILVWLGVEKLDNDLQDTTETTTYYKDIVIKYQLLCTSWLETTWGVGCC
jgi:hypothetical protein